MLRQVVTSFLLGGYFHGHGPLSPAAEPNRVGIPVFLDTPSILGLSFRRSRCPQSLDYFPKQAPRLRFRKSIHTQPNFSFEASVNPHREKEKPAAARRPQSTALKYSRNSVDMKKKSPARDFCAKICTKLESFRHSANDRKSTPIDALEGSRDAKTKVVVDSVFFEEIAVSATGCFQVAGVGAAAKDSIVVILLANGIFRW